MRATEDCIPGVNGPLDFNYESLGRQLHIFLGPRPTQEDFHHILYSLANITFSSCSQTKELE
jgi:hypothetical protein